MATNSKEAKSVENSAEPKGFTKVTQLTTIAKMKSHADYEAAKAGDAKAAERLVRDMMAGKAQQDKIKALAEKHPGAVLAAVHAKERTGKNKIPQAIAYYIGKATGLEIDTDIVQSSKVGHAGQDAWHRLAFRAKFDGEVKPGRKYILVDDVVTGGGTFGELRRHIELNGGKTVDMLCAGAAQFSTNIALSEKTRLDIEKKFGIESLQKFLLEEGLYGGDYQSLTESEARLVLGAGTLVKARDRIAEARQEGSQRILRGSFQGHQGNIGSQEINLPNDNKFLTNLVKASHQTSNRPSEIEVAKKAGYVQGVCECVAAIGSDYALGKKLLAKMNVNQNLAKKYANPETLKALESGIFAQKQGWKLERQQKTGQKR
jgi:predicted amidophosphoribosyltransferase